MYIKLFTQCSCNTYRLMEKFSKFLTNFTDNRYESRKSQTGVDPMLQFLSNLRQHVSGNWHHCLSNPVLKFRPSVGSDTNTISFTWRHQRESRGVRSGDLGGQERCISSSSIPGRIHCCGILLFLYRRIPKVERHLC
jgi:hypothetical protein